MEHITEYCGTPTNLIACTAEEYSILQAALVKVGVEIRMTSRSGNHIECQMCNPYRDWSILGSRMNGEEIATRAKQDIANGAWQR